MLTTAAQSQTSLAVLDPQALRQEMGLTAATAMVPAVRVDDQLEHQAQDFVKTVLAWDPNDDRQLQLKDQHVQAAEALGLKTQQDAAYRSSMLREPIRKLAARGEDGGEVANSLVELKMQVEELDPGKFDFEAGWFTRMLGFLPGVGTPLKRYFTRFEASQTVMDAIVRALNEGKATLVRDNGVLTQDQQTMRLLTRRLEKSIQLGMLIDNHLSAALERELTADDARRRFIGDELIFPLRQRIQDLQQQLAVNQQGVLALEIIIRNNKELIKGVERALNVTINALNVAVTVALALANQKIVLDKISAINQTTNNLIASTAAQLRTQGAEIHKQSSTTQLDMATLKQSFADINAALDDISNFRQQALPQMASQILELDELTRTTDAAIRKMEQGNRAAPVMVLDVDE